MYVQNSIVNSRNGAASNTDLQDRLAAKIRSQACDRDAGSNPAPAELNCS